ncbi:phosphoethanolamine--lipid A transferase [Schlegelella sp. S2-27]|uniref:Phosphoethanolamine--lipid A transferase n=1 Tax=Caldimonas mangrovi TaxID=2944811 RepID=A0ABT0YR51_9BURK|nr:phosphoethanolamine--lipid A transferase [Caldimonas mangrovi]MCM5681204.1 phosphoethanolamine--lipid A transferase [Caldimonas mangrovi]
MSTVLPTPDHPAGTYAAAAQAHTWHPAAVNVMASLWLAIAANLPLWRALHELPSLAGGMFWRVAGALAVAIAAALVLLLSLVGTRLLKPSIVVLLFVAAATAHFMWAYRVVIDPSMVANVLQTDVHETADLVSPGLLGFIVAVAVLPSIWFCRLPVRRLGWRRRWLQQGLLATAAAATLVLALMVSFQPLAATMRNHKTLRYLINPLSTVYAIGATAARPLLKGPLPAHSAGEDAVLGASYVGQRKPPLLVLVLGETGRSGNFGLNGYARDTTPELAREDVVSFRNAWSCGTSTAASVPCMFSHLGRSAFADRSYEYENLLDMLQRAGLAVLWVDNQAGCKGTCARIPHVSSTGTQDPLLCSGGECLDEVMLRSLEARWAELPAERRAKGTVVVLHQMGSHGPAYYKRSSRETKRFLPECTRNALQDCSRESLVNAYDNSIAYTDRFLAATITWLKAQAPHADGAMVYVADHGESLGESNLYLHGLPYALAPDEQKHVPWIVWTSTGFAARIGLRVDCLRRRVDVPLSHDHYFHSVLAMMDVHTALYDPALDPYAPCSSQH